MIKTTITEVTKKFDKEGRIVEETTRTEESTDDTEYCEQYPYDRYFRYPNLPMEPTCETKGE